VIIFKLGRGRSERKNYGSREGRKRKKQKLGKDRGTQRRSRRIREVTPASMSDQEMKKGRRGTGVRAESRGAPRKKGANFCTRSADLHRGRAKTGKKKNRREEGG